MEVNRIIQGDCLEVMLDMPDESVDLVVTDPPYGINYQSHERTQSPMFAKLINDDNDSGLLAYKELHRVLKNNSVAAVFCSFKNYADDYKELEKYFSIKNCIIWNKGGGGIGDLIHSLVTDYEMVIIAHKGGCPIRDKRHGSVWKSQKVNAGTMLHPTEKPVEIIGKIIQSFSDEGSLVFDPYVGSGTTCVAAQQLGRDFVGIEIDEKYCEIARQRLRQLTLL